MHFLRHPLFSRLALLLSLWLGLFLPSFASAPTIYQISIDSAIGPATHDFLQSGIQQASNHHADLLLIQLDTPGGLVTSMREMATTILNAPIPVGDDSRMPDKTPPKSPPGVSDATQDIPAPATSGQTYSETKVLEDLSAFMRALAQKNQRNEALGIAMVQEGRSFTAQEALRDGIINFMSHDIADLLTQLDQKTVVIQGKAVTLHTKDGAVIPIEPNWRTRFLSILTDPNITYVLLLIGMYGILLEFYSPGALYPGVIGGICLILAGYSLHLLPISYAGLSLIILGIIFLAFEGATPSYGILGVGGIIAFVVGSIFLLDTKLPGFGIAPALIFAMTLVTAGFLLTIVRFVVGAMTRPVESGAESFIGKKVTALETFTGYGSVLCDGSIYRAYCASKVHKNSILTVYKVEGITLYVRSTPTRTIVQS
jgi:membrane-bound serine protease (ClpP class)